MPSYTGHYRRSYTSQPLLRYHQVLINTSSLELTEFVQKQLTLKLIFRLIDAPISEEIVQYAEGTNRVRFPDNMAEDLILVDHQIDIDRMPNAENA